MPYENTKVASYYAYFLYHQTVDLMKYFQPKTDHFYPKFALFSACFTFFQKILFYFIACVTDCVDFVSSLGEKSHFFIFIAFIIALF